MYDLKTDVNAKGRASNAKDQRKVMVYSKIELILELESEQRTKHAKKGVNHGHIVWRTNVGRLCRRWRQDWVKSTQGLYGLPGELEHTFPNQLACEGIQPSSTTLKSFLKLRTPSIGDRLARNQYSDQHMAGSRLNGLIAVFLVLSHATAKSVYVGVRQTNVATVDLAKINPVDGFRHWPTRPWH
ncbi:hypothetical protein B0H12DRAFT_1079793 [Mycena haematopus]|nr:hypothetical protein B0H12DRAFT_1079793 [Mycena haematopus]